MVPALKMRSGTQLLQRRLDRPDARRVFGNQFLDLLLEARRVRHEVTHGDRLAVGARRNLEVEVLVDVGVEVDLALFDQLHDRGPGEQLRDRARTEQRLVRVDGQLLLDVRVAEALLQQDLAVLDDHDDAAGDVAARERVGQEAVEPGFEVLARELRRGGRRPAPRPRPARRVPRRRAASRAPGPARPWKGARQRKVSRLEK